MSRTTRNSNKNTRNATDNIKEDVEQDVTKRRAQKNLKKDEEEDESSNSDEFIIVKNPLKDSPLAKADLLVQQKTENKLGAQKVQKTENKLLAHKSKVGKQEETRVKLDTDAKISTPMFAVLGIFIVLVSIFVSLFLESSSNTNYTNLEPELTKLFQDFKSQPAKSDRKIRMRALSYLNDKISPQPFVIMIVATRKDQFAADCFANRLGKLFDSEPLVINGSLYTGIQSDKAKLEIDEKLQETFQENFFPTVAIIHNLERLSFETSMLFYKYCDHDHPRYRKAAIIFTVTLPDDFQSISATDDEVVREGMVESYLTEESIWVKDKDFDINKLGALLSRISDTVVVLRSETRESLESFCNK